MQRKNEAGLKLSMKWALRLSLAPSISRRSRVAWQRWEAVVVAARSSLAREEAAVAAVVDKSEVVVELRTGLHRAAVLEEVPETTLPVSKV